MHTLSKDDVSNQLDLQRLTMHNGCINTHMESLSPDHCILSKDEFLSLYCSLQLC